VVVVVGHAAFRAAGAGAGMGKGTAVYGPRPRAHRARDVGRGGFALAKSSGPAPLFIAF
jgi:hypothetical protein